MVDWPENRTRVVEELIPKARAQLVTITEGSALVEAAKLLQAGAELVIVCDAAGILAGVITKTDVVAQLSQCQGSECIMTKVLVMTSDVVFCQPGDLLSDVWIRMKAQNLKHIPVLDRDIRPLGLLHAPDILEVLLSESENEDAMLRDYVMGVGYR